MEFNVLSLNAFFRLVHYSAARRISYERIMVGCEGNGMLLRIPVAMVDKRFGFCIQRLILILKVDPVLALSAVARVVEVDCAAFLDEEWFPYGYAHGTIVLRPREGSSMAQNVEGVVGEELDESLVCLAYRAGHGNRGISMVCASEAWH